MHKQRSSSVVVAAPVERFDGAGSQNVRDHELPCGAAEVSAGHSVNNDERLSIDNNLGGNADFNSSLMVLTIGDFFIGEIIRRTSVCQLLMS